MTDLKTRIDNIYALDLRRTQEPFEVRCHEKQQGCYMIDFMVDRRLKGKVWLNGQWDIGFFQHANEMVDIIRSLEAKVEELEELVSGNPSLQAILTQMQDDNKILQTKLTEQDKLLEVMANGLKRCLKLEYQAKQGLYLEDENEQENIRIEIDGNIWHAQSALQQYQSYKAGRE